MTYRLLIHDLVGGHLIGEARPTSASWQLGLNGAGSATITTPTALLEDALGGPVRERLGRSCVTFLAEDGTVPWSGVLWQANVDLDGATQLAAAPLMSMLQRRVVRSDLSYSSTDQATIAVGLVNHAQDTSGGRSDRQLNIDTSSVTTHSEPRTIEYLAAEAQPIAEALVELAELADGFTLALTPQLSSSYALSHTLELAHPASGVASSTVLLHRSNVLVGQLALDATGMTTDVVAFGSQGITNTTTSAIANWPAFEVTSSWSDVTTTGRLTELANRQLSLGSAPQVVPAAQLIGDDQPAELDQLVRLIVPELDLDAEYRVMATATQLADSIAVTSLTLANGELFA